ncbi:MAG: stage II sporulation protein R, partial [Clostridia bacterium]|nr:stage II sporulation protein R [Clostridia bacterium]
MEKKLLNAIVIVFSVLILFSMLPLRGEAAVYDTVVRLHVIANSDSEEDQARKLRVRDAVLALTDPLLADCSTQEEAQQRLLENMDAIQRAAEDKLAAEGRNDPVSVTLTKEEDPERSYDEVCFPSGEYLSLRVCIGDAVGQNWWCCLFPPLCLSASTVSAADAESSFISVGLTPSQYKIITETDT